MIVQRSALVAQPAGHLYDLIEAAENYPLFLPWCAGATILERSDTVVAAELRIAYGGMHFSVRTRNAKRRPEAMTIHLESGPFRRFEGLWTLTALTPAACKVEFRLDWEFETALLTRAAGPAFRRVADTLVDAFVRRAIEFPAAAGNMGAAACAAPSDATAPTEPIKA